MILSSGQAQILKWLPSLEFLKKNPAVLVQTRSPLHWLLSEQMLLISPFSWTSQGTCCCCWALQATAKTVRIKLKNWKRMLNTKMTFVNAASKFSAPQQRLASFQIVSVLLGCINRINRLLGGQHFFLCHPASPSPWCSSSMVMKNNCFRKHYVFITPCADC